MQMRPLISRFLIWRALVPVLAVVAAALPAAAQSVVSTGQSFLEGRLISGERQADGSRLAGLSLRLADGWKTYWRSPGQAGVPPSFDWTGSENVEAIEVMWPRPQLFESFGLRTVGYRGQVVLPIRVVPKDPSRPIRLKLAANMGVCKDVCIMEQFSAAHLIGARAKDETGAVAAAAATVPPAGRDAGLRAATCRVMGRGKKRRLELRLSFEGDLERPEVLVEGTDSVWVTGIESRKTAPGVVDVGVDLRLMSETSWIDRAAFRMTVLAKNRTADIRGCRAPAG